MAAETKLLTWGPESQALLDAWVTRGRALGLTIPDVTTRGATAPSASAGIREALKHAAACRCVETTAEVVAPVRAPVPSTSADAHAGAALHAARVARGLTMRGLAEALGCCHTTVGRMERGTWPLSAAAAAWMREGGGA